MIPAQPPLPTPANFPFQLSNGSQTSKTICDSGVGAMTPATRQKGGRLPITFVDPAAVNDPEVRKAAAKYGNPDELLKEDWIPNFDEKTGRIIYPKFQNE